MAEYDEFMMWNHTWPEVKKNLETNDIVLVSVSSTEQHGRHLPVCTDAAIGLEVCKRTLKRFYEETGRRVYLAAEIRVGMSKHHMSFPGTLSLEPETLMHVVVDVCNSLIHHGYRKIILVNSHGGNRTVLEAALRKVKDQHSRDDLFLCVVWQYALDTQKWKEISDAGPKGSAHAGEHETSLMMTLGYKVRTNELPRKAKPPTFPFPDFTSFSEAKYPGSVSWAWNTPELTQDGYIGDPTANPSAEKGEISYHARAEAFVEFLRQVAAS